GLSAGLASRRHVALNGERGEEQHGEQSAADHPTHGDAGKSGWAGAQQVAEAEVTHGLDHSGKNEAECENQSGPVMRATKTHQGVGGEAEAQKSSACFKIEIDLRRSGDARLPKVEDRAKKENRGCRREGYQNARRQTPPGDRGAAL